MAHNKALPPVGSLPTQGGRSPPTHRDTGEGASGTVRREAGPLNLGSRSHQAATLTGSTHSPQDQELLSLGGLDLSSPVW